MSFTRVGRLQHGQGKRPAVRPKKANAPKREWVVSVLVVTVMDSTLPPGENAFTFMKLWWLSYHLLLISEHRPWPLCTQGFTGGAGKRYMFLFSLLLCDVSYPRSVCLLISLPPQSRRHEMHRSQNRVLAQWELRERALRHRRKKGLPGSPAPLDRASLNIIREVRSTDRPHAQIVGVSHVNLIWYETALKLRTQVSSQLSDHLHPLDSPQMLLECCLYYITAD